MIETAILHYCKYQERCHSEVRNKLYELGCNTAEVDEQLSSLITAGVVNEERFARAFARGKFRIKHWGRAKIRQQLKLKKVSEYCIRKAMTEIDEVEYTQTLARFAAAKVNELKREPNIFIKKAKAYRYLVQKGYEQDLVKTAIDEAINNT